MSIGHSYSSGVGDGLSFEMRVNEPGGIRGWGRRQWRKLRGQSKLGLEDAAAEVIRTMKEYIRETDPQILNREEDRMNLEKGLQAETVGENIRISNEFMLADLHEIGGILTDSEGMTVPLSPEAKAFEGRYREGASHSFPIQLRMATINGKKFLLDKDNNYHYVIKHAIKIPARPVMSRAKTDAALLKRIENITKRRMEVVT